MSFFNKGIFRALLWTGFRKSVAKAVFVLITAAVFSAVPPLQVSAAEPAQKKNTRLFELFKFFVIEKGKEIRGDLKGLRARQIAYEQAVRDAEERFGMLPEYWEMRAESEARSRSEDKLSPESAAEWAKQNTFSETDVNGEDKELEPVEPWVQYYFTEYDIAMIRKALELDPARPQLIALLGDLELAERAEEYGRAKDAGEFPIWKPEWDYIAIDGYAKAASIDPDNGYYPFMEAVDRIGLGEIDDALILFEKAVECDKFTLPELFPQSFKMMDVLEEEVDETFNDPEFGLLFFYAVLSLQNDTLAPEIVISDAYTNAQLAVRLGYPYARLFTAMHRAACKFGTAENAIASTGARATLLIKVLSGEALQIALAEGDAELEKTALLVYNSAEGIRASISNSTGSLMTSAFYVNFMDFYAIELTYLLDDIYKKGLSDERIKYIFDAESSEQFYERLTEYSIFNSSVVSLLAGNSKSYMPKAEEQELSRLSTLDYNNPLKWYESWLVRNKFTEPVEDSQ